MAQDRNCFMSPMSQLIQSSRIAYSSFCSGNHDEGHADSFAAILFGKAIPMHHRNG